ncbi:MAG: competence/damage-inducible protein A [Verrucomicrobia bacterium]|nr:competence/damage-inducible protein A [Verrucomicrobiota bacterium]
MNIELINTGAELMLGRVLNTHQQWLCRQLADMGLVVTRQVAVDDSASAISQAVQEALARAPLVITTGGLGPTSDDRTRDVIAALLGRKLHLDDAVLRQIESYFTARKRRMVESTKVQALVPEGATVLLNAFGTAPGLVIEAGHASHCDLPQLLVMLPGPPRELRPMFTNQVAPLLKQRYPQQTALVCRTLKTTGLGESLLEEKIAGPLQPLVAAGLELGYCARVGEVDVRFAARGELAAKLVAEAESLARSLIGELVFGADEDSLEAAVVQSLTERKLTLATAESCTGGLIANRLTNVPGASVVFWGGLVSYANEAKQASLGVRAETLAQHGAVSRQTACEMADGARQRAGTDYALAVTGIAGPTGGTADKPVGTVFIGLATPGETLVQRHLNPFDRETFKWVTSQQALDLLRRAVSGLRTSA